MRCIKLDHTVKSVAYVFALSVDTILGTEVA